MRILRLVLLTNDLKQTKDFYTRVLNLPVIGEESAELHLQAGNTALIFRESTVVNPIYHFAFNISNNKIEEAAVWCEEKGLQLLPYPPEHKIIDFPNWNAKSVYFLDNNGNILEFIARFDLPTESDLPFSEKDILSVSEIGIVTKDVLRFCQRSEAECGIPFYAKQPPAPNFSVMGDAEGLLIVVPEHRHWFPTDIPSAKVPLEVDLEQAGKKYSLR